MKLSARRAAGKLRILVKRIGAAVRFACRCCGGGRTLTPFLNECPNHDPRVVYVDEAIRNLCPGAFRVNGQCYNQPAGHTYPNLTEEEAREQGYITITDPIAMVCVTDHDTQCPVCEDRCCTFVYLPYKCNKVSTDPPDVCCNWGTEYVLTYRQRRTYATTRWGDRGCNGVCINPVDSTSSGFCNLDFTYRFEKCDELGNIRPASRMTAAYSSDNVTTSYPSCPSGPPQTNTDPRSGVIDNTFSTPASVIAAFGCGVSAYECRTRFGPCAVGCPPGPVASTGLDCNGQLYCDTRAGSPDFCPPPNGDPPLGGDYAIFNESCATVISCFSGFKQYSGTYRRRSNPLTTHNACAMDVPLEETTISESVTWSVQRVRTNNCDPAPCDAWNTLNPHGGLFPPPPITSFDLPI